MDLAAEIGLSHEALYRTLAELEQQGTISRSRGTITLNPSYDPDHRGTRAPGIK
jgi:DeoR/GlpR family transcriptional regulator of sugar metabolism